MTFAGIGGRLTPLFSRASRRPDVRDCRVLSAHVCMAVDDHIRNHIVCMLMCVYDFSKTGNGRARRFVAGHSRWRPEFNPKAVHVGYVEDKVILEQVFHRVFRFSLVILPVFLTHHLHVAVSRTKGEAWEPASGKCSSGNRVALDEKHFHFILSLKG